jgi:hypothetical protein
VYLANVRRLAAAAASAMAAAIASLLLLSLFSEGAGNGVESGKAGMEAFSGTDLT